MSFLKVRPSSNTGVLALQVHDDWVYYHNGILTGQAIGSLMYKHTHIYIYVIYIYIFNHIALYIPTIYIAEKSNSLS